MSEKHEDTQSVLEALIRQAVGVENPYGWFIHTFDDGLIVSVNVKEMKAGMPRPLPPMTPELTTERVASWLEDHDMIEEADQVRSRF